MSEETMNNFSRERILQLGFKPQKENIYNKVLPYADKLDEESRKMFADIKAFLGKAVMLREMRPACGMLSAKLVKYIKIYGLKFSKEDHIALVKLMYELLTIPNLEPYLVNRFAQILIILLKKIHLLSPDDLVLDWRPLYNLQHRILDSSYTRLGMYRYFSSLENTFDTLVHAARYYFPITATQEILDELKPKLSPLSGHLSVLDELEWFLPVAVPPSKAHMGYKLWFEDLMNLWMTCTNSPQWENDVMWLMAKLASHNIGYIDWEPYIPFMFSKFLHVFNLPVVYKHYPTTKLFKMETAPISLWIVSVLGGNSSCQQYLDKFLKTVESYFHPANFGRWLIKLKEFLRRLPNHFIQRLHNERYRKPSWETPTPDSHRLTEQDIDRFVDGIKSVAMQAVFLKLGAADVCIALQHLATLRPKTIIPTLIDRMYTTLDSVTEPHKLTSVMQCVAAVARPMVQGAKSDYPEGPTHVIPLLMSTIPGIDPNDFRKCFVTFQFISMFAILVPLVDCSKASDYYNDLTEEEEVICAASANFEDFVVQLFDRIFVLIENSSLEATRMEKEVDKRSKIENLAASALSSVCFSVLTETSPQIFQTALRKLHTFVSERILETKVAGHLVAVLCKSFSRVNPEETLKCLVPQLCRDILALTECDDVQTEEILDEELLYKLLILSEVIECRGNHAMLYIDDVKRVLDRTLTLTSREGYVIATKLLKNILSSLTTLTPLEHRAASHPYDKHIKDYLPIREWGKPGNIHELNLKWHVPGPDEIKCVEELVWRYLPPELARLEKHISGEFNLQREQLLCSLCVISGVLGCHSVLPQWSEPQLKLLDSKLPWLPFNVTLGIEGSVTMPDGSNVRKTLADVMQKLQKKMLSCAEDDTKSFFMLIQIWEALLLNHNRGANDFESRWKDFHLVKKVSEDKLVGNKRHLRSLLIERSILQHSCRSEKNIACLTETHKMIMLNLFELGTSHYSEVRCKAQLTLFHGLDYYSYSYRVLIPELWNNLQLDSMLHHEKFKGSLYTLLGPKQTPVIARHDWEMLLKLWPTIVKAKPSEKLSVIRLLENIVENIHKHFPTITISLVIPDSCLEAARALWSCEPKPDIEQPTQQEIEQGLLNLQEKNQQNLKIYMDILNELMDAVELNTLHWRFHNMALCFIRDLVHPELPYPARIVKTYLSALIHDSIDLRKIGIRTTVFILKQQKRKHKKIKVRVDEIESNKELSSTANNTLPGVRSDNYWLQYDSRTRPLSEEEWNKPRYYHKPNYGFYQLPKEIELYAPASEQPNLDRVRDELKPEEQTVYDFFSDPDNIAKLIKYHSLEEKKGKDKFNGFKFILFKGLFRNHGDQFLDVIKPHLDRLVVDKLESSQRCAAEIITGIIRGSKHWPYDKVSKLWDYLVSLIRTALSNMTEETVSDWGICFATSSENRDPNRHHWLLEVLMEDPLRNQASFLQCGRMYALQGALNQQEWRVAELRSRLLDYFKPHLHHPFQNVRERIASILTNIFQSDINLPNANKPLPPYTSQFMSEVEPQLKCLYSITFSGQNDLKNGCKQSSNDIASKLEKLKLLSIDEDNGKIIHKVNGVVNSISNSGSSETDVAIRLFKTICKWITASLSRSACGVIPEFYAIFPLICLLENYEQDEDLSKLCSMTLSYLAQFTTPPRYIPTVLDSVTKVSQSGSWWARSSVVAFLQVFTFHNMSSLLSRGEWVDQVVNLVLLMLEDERLEVRVKSGQVLSGLLHCDFITDTKLLLEQFKRKCKTKIVKVVSSSSSAVVDQSNIERIKVRHSGVLGLCSFINSSPYDVPDYVPDIFFILGNHLNDPQPISSTIKKTLDDFKRTHYDNWEIHKQKFTERQLEVLNDLFVPPSYFA